MLTAKFPWIEQLYKYVEYYYWQPQQLSKQQIPGKTGGAVFEKVRQRMRLDEVPLNAIFNISVGLLPSRVLNQLLNCFTCSKTVNFGKRIELVDIHPQIQDPGSFAQPDLVLESDTSRVLVELKIGAKFNLSQIYKYLFLHVLWNRHTGVRKKPYLFLLSREELYNQWKTSEREAIFVESKEASEVLKYLKRTALPTHLDSINSLTNLHEEAQLVLETLEVGFATWNTVGDLLKGESDRLNERELSDGEEVIDKLIDDLLNELKNRRLWSEGQI